MGQYCNVFLLLGKKKKTKKKLKNIITGQFYKDQMSMTDFRYLYSEGSMIHVGLSGFNNNPYQRILEKSISVVAR